MEFKGLLITTLLIGLFLFAIISFGVNLSLDNNQNATILQNKAINKTFGQLGTNLSNSRSTAEGQKTATETEVPTAGSDSLLLLSIKSAIKVFSSTMTNIYNLTFGLIFETLGLSAGTGAVILGTMFAILAIVIVFLGWRVLKAGE